MDEDGNQPFNFQWLRDGVEIPGETGAGYTLVVADTGAEISARVTMLDLQGTLETVTSSPTVPVVLPDVDPVIQGTDAGEVLTGTDDANEVFAGGGNDTILAEGGNDTVFGGNGRDEVFLGNGDDQFNDNGQGGDFGRDTVFAGNGNDTVQGGNGDDAFHGDAGNDLIIARLGNDAVFGGDGFDTVFGGDGNDTVFGGNGRDEVFLGNGDDRYEDMAQTGEFGQDTISGGAGEDVFVFRANNGNDVIEDFEAGVDTLLLDASLREGRTDDQLLEQIVLQVGDDLVLTFNAGNSVTLRGVTADESLLDDLAFF